MGLSMTFRPVFHQPVTHVSSGPDLKQRFDCEARAITGFPRRAAEVYTLLPFAIEAAMIVPIDGSF